MASGPPLLATSAISCQHRPSLDRQRDQSSWRGRARSSNAAQHERPRRPRRPARRCAMTCRAGRPPRSASSSRRRPACRYVHGAMARRWSAGRAMPQHQGRDGDHDGNEAQPLEDTAPTSRASTLRARRAAPAGHDRQSAVPSRISRRWPKRSAVERDRHAAQRRDQVDHRQQPAGLRAGWRPARSRIDRIEGGTLPTWNAATMPAATSRPTSPHGVRAGRRSVLHPRRDGAVDDAG